MPPGEDDRAEAPEHEGPALWGFWDTRAGVRTQEDPNQGQLSLAETRLQLQLGGQTRSAVYRVTADLLLDALADEYGTDLRGGDGILDLRKANLLFGLGDPVDVKLGRQILTWGTGDLIFVNDLFPKDFQSFFVGRAVDYLKAPSDSIKVSGFTPALNVDFVYTPLFEPDRFIDGSTLSFFNPVEGELTGEDQVLAVDQPDQPFVDDEAAARLYRTVGVYELALYGYNGFWKSPAGFDPQTGEATFPPLSVYGASIQGPVGKALVSAEVGAYESLDDPSGDDPLIRNSDYRFLVGYRQEVAREVEFGFQYYLERMKDYAAYRRTLPPGVTPRDETRHLVTLRYTQHLLRQDLLLSLFSYYSPSDRDGYARPKVRYRFDDAWYAELGANILFGHDVHTFFGQLENDSNVYAAVHYSFQALE